LPRRRRSEAARWRALVVVVEYPGYGLSPGTACSEGVDRHVRAAYEHFTVTLGVRSERVVIFGASVGTGPAARLAAQVQAAGARVGALILQSPFTCVRDAAAALVGSVAYVMFERWDNAEALRALACPLLIVHGTADDVIPFAQGCALRDLREAAKLPCTFHAQPGATHNNYRAREDLSVPVACVPRAAPGAPDTRAPLLGLRCIPLHALPALARQPCSRVIPSLFCRPRRCSNFLVKVHAQGSALVIRPAVMVAGAPAGTPISPDGRCATPLPRVRRH
jgi:acetyl esterase/lipase